MLARAGSAALLLLPPLLNIGRILKSLACMAVRFPGLMVCFHPAENFSRPSSDQYFLDLVIEKRDTAPQVDEPAFAPRRRCAEPISPT